MFRRLIIGQRLIALLIPFSFVWGWSACTLLCTETAERHTEQAISINCGTEENCLNSYDPDSCPLTVSAAIIDSRQTITAPALTPAIRNLLSEELNEFLPIPTYPVDVRQNSPPSQSSEPPLFLKFGNFRI